MKKALLSIKIVALLTALILTFTSCSFSDVLGTLDSYITGNDTAAGDEFVSNLPLYEERNGNVPYFTEAEITATAFERYSELDSLGRCGVVTACIGKELMPSKNEERGDISGVKPTGWLQAKYDFIPGKYLYHRSHLIGWQLTAENDNEKNLITGTEHMNTDGMLPFENMVAAYIKEYENHVMYRVTPDFVGNNLVANGVLIEALSVEDNGKGISFCVYVYNAQPGVAINYKTGASQASSDGSTDITEPDDIPSEDIPGSSNYIINTDSKKFHLETCSYAIKIATGNKQYYTGYSEDLIKEGYTPCSICIK